MSNLFNNKDQKNNTDSVTEGATGVAKTGTGSKYTITILLFSTSKQELTRESTVLGDTLSGVTNTLGGVVGGASRGVGETVSGVTGQAGKPLGDGVANIGTSLEGAGQDVGKSARDAGQWKSN